MTRRSNNGGGGQIRRLVGGALLVASVSATSAVWASSPAEGYKSTAIEALNAAADKQAPEKVQPVTPAAPAQAPVAPTPVAAQPPQAAAAAQGQPAAPLSETLPLKPSDGARVGLEVGQDAPSGVSYMGLALAMLLLGGAAIAAFYLQKRGRRKGDGTPSTTLEVVSSIRVAGRYQVALIRVPGSMLVVGVTDKGLTLLTELPEDIVASTVQEAPRAESPARVVAQPASPPSPRPAPQTAAPGRSPTSPGMPRSQTVPPAVKAESSELFDQLLRLSDARAAAPSEPEVVEGEQADIRRRLQRYQQHGGIE